MCPLLKISCSLFLAVVQHSLWPLKMTDVILLFVLDRPGTCEWNPFPTRQTKQTNKKKNTNKQTKQETRGNEQAIIGWLGKGWQSFAYRLECYSLPLLPQFRHSRKSLMVAARKTRDWVRHQVMIKQHRGTHQARVTSSAFLSSQH